jgi:hypothetical protein
VLVEAADTAPFFHSNVVSTIEDAVNFYNSSQFNNAPGFGPNVGGIRLEATEVAAVAGFLRVINALENMRETQSSSTTRWTCSSCRSLSSTMRSPSYVAGACIRKLK